MVACRFLGGRTRQAGDSSQHPSMVWDFSPILLNTIEAIEGKREKGDMHNMQQSSSLLDACRNLDDNEIIECINKGLDKRLGPSASQIILKTLKVAYGLDDKNIPSSLDAFESSIRKALGDFAASMVLESIANECRLR